MSLSCSYPLLHWLFSWWSADLEEGLPIWLRATEWLWMRMQTMTWILHAIMYEAETKISSIPKKGRHQSSKAYETPRQSGCIQLPSQRTFRDYTPESGSLINWSCKSFLLSWITEACLSSSRVWEKKEGPTRAHAVECRDTYKSQNDQTVIVQMWFTIVWVCTYICEIN